MADEDLKTEKESGKDSTQSKEADDWKDHAAELAKKLLELLQDGVKKKKKADKLDALAELHERVGDLKHMLLTKYKGGIEDSPPTKKNAAGELVDQLKELQDLLKTVRTKIGDGEDIASEREKAEELIKKIKEQLDKL